MNDERIKILKERAEKLARPLVVIKSLKDNELELIQFRLGSELYALESRYVSEVYPLDEISKLPNTPPFLAGIINVRRRIVAVIDLAAYFNLNESGENDQDKCGIILHHGANEFAIITTEVVGGIKVPFESIQAPIPSLTTLQQEFIKGVTQDGTVILNTLRLLNDKGLKIEDLN